MVKTMGVVWTAYAIGFMVLGCIYPVVVMILLTRPRVKAAFAAHKPFDPNAEYDRLVGQTLDGRYAIERKIGEGGMGVVFAARHAIIERQLAIKVLKKEVARDQSVVKRFIQEAMTSRSVVA